MSEVKRYEINWPMEEEYEHPQGRFVMASDFDVAQSELAALREELAKCKAQLEHWHSLDMQREQRLADAERRNAVLTKALVDTREALGREYWDQYAGLDETRDILDAALNPTESGAGE
ncbi:hypothetical protein [Pseudomonas mohnii]